MNEKLADMVVQNAVRNGMNRAVGRGRRSEERCCERWV